MGDTSDSYIGEIILYPFAKVPTGWMACEGQSLSMGDAANQPLFSVIGNQFGGDGRNAFNLPDLRGLAVMGAGDSPVLSPRAVGESAGTNAVALNSGQVGHSHTLFSAGQINPDADKTNAPLPTSNLGALSLTHPGGQSTAEFSYVVNGQPNKQMHPAMIGQTGNDAPHENRQPFLAMHHCICVDGLYPS